MDTQIKGILAAPVVPYDQDGKVTEELLNGLYKFLIEGGVHGLFAGGSTGEWPLLKYEERKLVARTAAAAAGGKIPVVINVSSLIPDEAVGLATYAREIGADAAAILAPSYFSYDDKGMEDYFDCILAKTDLPVILYNIPSNTKNAISPGLLKRLALKHSNIIGMKDSSMDFMTFLEYSEIMGPDFPVLIGNDGQILPALMWGGAGAVAATASIFPRTVVEIYNRFMAGDVDGAKAIQSRIIRLRAILRSHVPVAAHKACLNLQGITVGGPRIPLHQLSEEQTAVLAVQLHDLGLLPEPAEVCR